ncbi:MAG: leucyl/phenylalanyl-tRNA--protein transferase [Nitriliruptoraceae bacterium]
MEVEGRQAPGREPRSLTRQGTTARPPRPVPPSVWDWPEPEDGDGLVGFGADLLPATLVDAYRHGIFPWPHDGVALPWFSPDPRGVLLPGGMHVSRSLRRTLRRCGWTTTVDTATAAVIAACAEDRAEGTWITSAMQRAYLRLHELGWVHSVEVWEGSALIGGIYGVQVGGIVTGESMFHRRSDASKVALLDLLDRLSAAGGLLLDVQLLTDHLARLGAVELPRAAFLARLATHRDDDVRLALHRRSVTSLEMSGTLGA